MFAQVCLRVFQAAGVKKASGAPRPPGPNDWSINDFLLFQPQTPQDAKALMAGMFGGRIVKGKSKRTK